MKHKLPLLVCFWLSTFVFSQASYTNEKEIADLENYQLRKIQANIDSEVTLHGTLITPKTDYNTILVIVSGTGRISQKAHNYLTQYLLDHNIGVFKFDKRGVGASSGTYNDQAEVYTKDFVQVYKALEASGYLQGKTIGWLGHSLGGMVTVSALEAGIKPNFLIQWATPILKPRDVLKHQIENGIKNYDNIIVGETTEARIAALEYVFELIDTHPEKSALELWKIAKKTSKKKGVKKKAFAHYLMPHQVTFARLDQTNLYKALEIPTLVIIGSEDTLVSPTQSQRDVEYLDNANIRFETMPGLNHFMTAPGTDIKKNVIYDVDLRFKKSLTSWIEAQH